MEEKDIIRELLEIYLRSRSSMPQDGYIPEFRTTVDIQEELEPMLHVSGMDIVEYLYDHGYRPTENDDGYPIWVIYRRVQAQQ